MPTLPTSSSVLAIWFFAILSAALTASNVFLLKKVSVLSAQLEQSGELLSRKLGVDSGTTVPAITGYDVSGHRLKFPYGKDSRKTVVLVFSPRCNACITQWPIWHKIVASLDGKKFRVVAIDQASLTSTDYLDTYQLRDFNVIASPDAETILAYDLRATPQTILVGATGIVEAVWTGANMSATQRRVQARLLNIDPSLTRVD